MSTTRGIGRRFGWVAVACTVMAVSACIPAAPPPTYLYPSPVLTVTVTPAQPAAGQPVSFEIHAQHPIGVTSVVTSFSKSKVVLPASYGCSDAAQQVSGPATDEVVTINCTLPADTPRGQWRLRVGASALDSKAVQQDVNVLVTGTSTDTQAPVLVGDPVVSPTPVVAGQPVVLTAQVSDKHGPITVVPDPIASTTSPTVSNCTSTTSATATPNLWNITMTCTVMPPPWLMNIVVAYADDAFGFQSKAIIWVIPLIQ